MEEKTSAKSNSIKRECFTDEELLKIFNPETYPNKLKDKTRFLISLWALYSGARLNEICQLRFEDIKQQDGIWCFDINLQLQALGRSGGIRHQRGPRHARASVRDREGA